MIKLRKLYYFFKGSKLTKVSRYSDRSLYKLLLILKQALKEGELETGLCRLTIDLHSDDIISTKECTEILNWIRVTEATNVDNLVKGIYWFEPGLVKPRLEIINKQLSKFENIIT